MPTSIGHGMIPSKTKLGKFLRGKRIALALNQTQMARKLKMFTSNYSLLETGRNQHLNSFRIMILADLFHCNKSKIERLVIPRSGRICVFREKAVNDDSLGGFIRSRRKQLGLNQPALAEKLGKTTQWVSCVETGKIHLSYNTAILKKLARILKVRLLKLKSLQPKRKLNIPREDSREDGTFGAFVTDCRVQFGITQRELAHELHIYQTILCQIELGNLCPSDQIIKTLRKFFSKKLPKIARI